MKTIINKHGEKLFEVNSVGYEIGLKTRSKGKMYPHKKRIKNIINANNIKTFFILEEEYFDLESLKHFIASTNTKEKNTFIESLKKNNVLDLNYTSSYIRKEDFFITYLKNVFKPLGLNLVIQKEVCGYRLDAYIPQLNIVIEYDENNHFYYDIEKEETREKTIKNNLKCEFIRISDKKDVHTNIGIVIQKLLKLGVLSK